MNPNGFDEVLRLDEAGGLYTNAITKIDVPTLHIQNKPIPGRVKTAEFSELPEEYEIKGDKIWKY